MVYELVGFNTDARYQDDVRWRRYTTSEKLAEQWGKIRRIQFSDSGHGIVFSARELAPGAKRKKVVYPYHEDHADRELKRIKREEKLPDDLRALIDVARDLVGWGEPWEFDRAVGGHGAEHTAIKDDYYSRLYTAVEALG